MNGKVKVGMGVITLLVVRKIVVRKNKRNIVD